MRIWPDVLLVEEILEFGRGSNVQNVMEDSVDLADAPLSGPGGVQPVAVNGLDHSRNFTVPWNLEVR